MGSALQYRISPNSNSGVPDQQGDGCCSVHPSTAGEKSGAARLGILSDGLFNVEPVASSFQLKWTLNVLRGPGRPLIVTLASCWSPRSRTNWRTSPEQVGSVTFGKPRGERRLTLPMLAVEIFTGLGATAFTAVFN